ncbi:MAG: segregation/condensation protein A [Alphaproteobacteria bacterium]|nr:segregation/condensation protein A [Alphaproteobacteria bacterium]
MSEEFQEDIRFEAAEEAEGQGLVVDIDGFEGPLHLLLALARKKKIDLAKLSILELAEQYLGFMEAARQRRLDLAAEYLVMAAWLAFLKSKLLLPKPKKEDDEAPAEQMAAALAFRLRRLDAMRAAGEALYARPLVGRDVHLRGEPEGVRSTRSVIYEADLHDLLKAYATRRSIMARKVYRPVVPKVYGLEAARGRLEALLPQVAEWRDLDSLLPRAEELGAEAPPRRSVRASSVLAALEITKEGHAQIRQREAYAPLYVRAAEREDTPNE